RLAAEGILRAAQLAPQVIGDHGVVEAVPTLGSGIFPALTRGLPGILPGLPPRQEAHPQEARFGRGRGRYGMRIHPSGREAGAGSVGRRLFLILCSAGLGLWTVARLASAAPG